MTRRTWTAAETARLRRLVASRLPAAAIADVLGRSESSVQHKAHGMGLDWGRLLTEGERAVIRRHYATKTAKEVGLLIGRSAKSVWFAARAMGLSQPKFIMTAKGKKTLARLARQGHCNRCIGRALGMGKHARMSVRHWRRRLGLPDVASGGFVATCSPCMAKQRAKLQEQLERHGAKSLVEIRSATFRRRAAELGWPDDLPLPCVRILEALHAIGPMTRRELADAAGFTWRGSRNTFNAGGTSYLAMLLRRGLIVSLMRANRVTGEGKGKSTNVYMLALTTSKGVI